LGDALSALLSGSPLFPVGLREIFALRSFAARRSAQNVRRPPLRYDYHALHRFEESKLMRIAHLCLAALYVFASSIVASAATIPVSLALDTQSSHLSASVTLNGHQVASAAVPFVGGSVNADVIQAALLTPPSAVTNVTGSVDAGPFKIHTIIGDLSAKNLSLAVGPGAGPFPTNGADPALVDFAGLPASLDSGTIQVDMFSLANFANNPVNFTLPHTSATLTDNLMSLQVPVSASGETTFNFFGHQATLAYSLTGSIDFGGAVPIPEPGTAVLAGMAAVGFAILARRRRAAARSRTV